MKKRLFAFVLALCMVLSILPLRSNAKMYEMGREGYWIVGLDDQGLYKDYCIIGYTGNAANVTVPTTVAGYTISGIHHFAFVDNTTLRTLTVPDGITVYSLGGCDVETVNMGKNAKIGAYAFQNCKKLKTVNIPETQTMIPGLAFENCVSLSSITIPNGVESIGERAFYGCTSLSKITLPDSVTEIGIRAFMNCTGLQQINIPAAVEEIMYDAFDNCQSLSKITVASGNATFYNDADGNLCTYNSKQEQAELIRGLSVGYGESYTLPSDVQYIDTHAFSGAKGLKKLVIPENITWIAQWAFKDCANLTEIRFAGAAPRVFSNSFENVTAKVYYPGDLGEDSGWSNFSFDEYGSTLTWLPYCTGIHTGPVGTVITPPTCDKTGVASSICDLCKQTYSDVLPTLAHAYGDGVVTKPATCTAKGVMTYTCVDCGHVMTETIYAKEHDYDYSKGVILEESTCRKEGWIDYPCKDCDSHRQTRYPRIDHIYENNVCVMCGSGVMRIYGATRYETAFKLADEMIKQRGGNLFTNIIVASGTNFPDALSGSCLAHRKQAPILLVNGSTVETVKEYIRKNLEPGGTVYLLGGTAAVPASMETGLDEFTVKRLGGANRYETNLLILKEANIEYGRRIFFCTGSNYADSLSASALGSPVMLVGGELTTSQKEFLADMGSINMFILGGTSAVSPYVEKQIQSYQEVTRIAGATRYETSALFAEKFYFNKQSLILAYAENFPDGLSGGAFAGVNYSGLILTATGKESLAAEFAAQNGFTNGYVIGGPGLISDEAMNRVFGLTEDTSKELP